ncbi:MAG: DNA polymerase III subunit alpha, partial [Proteobacteria bacterium]|nr:DNA polymerase III subunit alpha [Pseudomonadota bacterium]
MQFTHLQVHSEYSLIDGIVRIESLVETAAKLGMPAVAITDQSNLFAAIKFYQAAIKAGIKPIIGCDIYLENVEHPESPYRATLLCQNQLGYKNLIHLVSQSYLIGQKHDFPLIRYAWLQEFNEGLIVLSGGCFGDVGQNLLAHKNTLAKNYLEFWKKYFPERYYLTIQRCGRANEERHIQLILPLASEHEIPVVATNDVRFIEKDDFDAHEARVCIRQGYTIDDPKRPKNYTEQQYLRSPDEMKKLFSEWPEVLENSIEIAKRCSLEFKLGVVHMPNFPLHDEVTVEKYLENKSWDGLEKRLQIIFRNQLSELNELRVPYDQRLKLELDVISKMGFAGYFLIVADFIQWSKQEGIPVGPGRGSGAGSLVAYALEITDLDPLQYDLLFERFLNPERVSMPDFDIDFCMEGRDRVIEYVMERYGRDRVSQIITYGSMAAKAVVRDVGRVLGHPYGFVDRIAKMIPFELGITLDKALEQSELQDLYQEDEEVRELIDLARILEGLPRNVGKHAGGVVISPAALTEYVSLYCEPNGDNLVTQFDKDDAEAIGLIKFDFLGLRTLTIIDWALKIINRERKEKNETLLDISLIDLADPTTFDLLKACKTTAVFQLESRGMKDLVRRLKPDCFEDIIALVALFRPGPLQSGMVDDFINRKHGLSKVEYLHPSLESVLKPTYGVILYQEQVMQIAQILAGYTLGEADLLRRAMGKKKPEEMAKQRSMFTEGAVGRGVDRRTATYIFDLMEKFAGYGFNKSHSAAYALLAYQTAWLKTHYPAAFMAAVLSSDMDNTDKVVNFIDDCRIMNLKVLPPHVNHSSYQFTVLDERTIVYGLGAIKGVGENAVDSIINARNQSGPFKNFFDFCLRVDLRKVNRRVIEASIKSGALDNLDAQRASMMASLDRALAFAEQR